MQERKLCSQGITFVFVRFLPISGYFKCYTCIAFEILSYRLECCQIFWGCRILWNFPQLVDNIFLCHFQCIFSGSISFYGSKCVFLCLLDNVWYWDWNNRKKDSAKGNSTPSIHSKIPKLSCNVHLRKLFFSDCFVVPSSSLLPSVRKSLLTLASLSICGDNIVVTELWQISGLLTWVLLFF